MKNRLLHFVLFLVTLFLIAGYSEADTESKNPSGQNQQIDSNEPLSLINLNGMFYGFRDDIDGGECGGTSTTASSSGDIESGTYKVENNTIILTGNDGSIRNLLFFLHDNDGYAIQLGERNYYVHDE